MAVAGPQHIRLLAEVRWLVFKNSLRAGFKKVETVFRVFAWVGGVSTVVVVALLIGAGGYVFFPSTHFMSIMLFAIFMAWQIIPLVLEGSMPALDFRQLARYPISFRTFTTMSLAYGLLDPIALTCLTCLGALALGSLVRHPAYAPAVLIFFALFAVMNLLLNRIVQRWVERITATRRGREWLLGGVIGVSILFQFFFWFVVPKVENADKKTVVRQVIPAINRWLPSGMAALGAATPLQEGPRSAAGLLLICGLLGLGFHRQLRGMYLGELESDVVVHRGAIQVQPGWELPFAGSQLSAMIEKELRQAFGVGRVWINQLSAWSFVLIAALSPEFLGRAFAFKSGGRAGAILPFAVGYSMIVFGTLAFNFFWSDAGGFYRWLLSPIPMRRLMLAKNLFFFTCALANLAVVLLLVSIGMRITLVEFLNTVLGAGMFALGIAAAGNLLSVWFPKKIDPGKFNTKNASEAATFIGLLVFGMMGGLWFLANLVGRWYQNPWLALAMLAGIMAVLSAVYYGTLVMSANYLEKNLDKLSEELA